MAGWVNARGGVLDVDTARECANAVTYVLASMRFAGLSPRPELVRSLQDNAELVRAEVVNALGYVPDEPTKHAAVDAARRALGGVS